MSVFVYTENWDGKFKKISFELVSYGYAMAKQLNVDLHIVSIGEVNNDELVKLAKYGAMKIHQVKTGINVFDPKVYSAILSALCQQAAAETIIFAHNNTGKALAPRLSVRLNAGLVAAAIGLPKSYKPFVVSKKLFTGKAYSDIEVKTQKQVITLSQNAYGIFENNSEAEIIFHDMSDYAYNSAIKLKDVSKVTGKVLLNDAEIVISGGRGMKAPENWGPIEELAEILGGATACSRPVSDEGWRPHSEHTGQTGKVIAPNLYFAFGISGAIQHVAGVSSSKIIVAVNKDPEAPIFEVADYGIVGDALKIVPELVNEVKKLKKE